MANPGFFDSPRNQSQVKAEIVARYFSSWASIILNSRDVSRIAYIDLYAGRGEYDDGTSPRL